MSRRDHYLGQSSLMIYNNICSISSLPPLRVIPAVYKKFTILTAVKCALECLIEDSKNFNMRHFRTLQLSKCDQPFDNRQWILKRKSCQCCLPFCLHIIFIGKIWFSFFVSLRYPFGKCLSSFFQKSKFSSFSI